MGEISLVRNIGDEFNNLIDFLKQSIIDTLSNSKAISFDAEIKMKDKIESRMQKKISVIVIEYGRSNNAFNIAGEMFKSAIIMQAKGFYFVFWTPK